MTAEQKTKHQEVEGFNQCPDCLQSNAVRPGFDLTADKFVIIRTCVLCDYRSVNVKTIQPPRTIEAPAKPVNDQMDKRIIARYESIRFSVVARCNGDYLYRGAVIGRYSRPRGTTSLFNVEFGDAELSYGHKTIGAACVSIHEKMNIPLRNEN